MITLCKSPKRGFWGKNVTLCKSPQRDPTVPRPHRVSLAARSAVKQSPVLTRNSLSCRTKRALFSALQSQTPPVRAGKEALSRRQFSEQCPAGDRGTAVPDPALHGARAVSGSLQPGGGQGRSEAPAPTPSVHYHRASSCCELVFCTCLVVDAQMHNSNATNQSRAELYSRGSSVGFTTLTLGLVSPRLWHSGVQLLSPHCSCNRRENLLETSPCLTITQQGLSSASKAVTAQ